MKPNQLLLAVVVVFAANCFGQTKIEASDGLHYLTTSIDYPVAGVYQYQGMEPIVELNAGGSGFYQLHEQLKRAVSWGIECDQTG